MTKESITLACAAYVHHEHTFAFAQFCLKNVLMAQFLSKLALLNRHQQDGQKEHQKRSDSAVIAHQSNAIMKTLVPKSLQPQITLLIIYQSTVKASS